MFLSTGGFMTITMTNVDFQLLEVLKNLVKTKKNVELIENDDSEKLTKSDEKYSARLEKFRNKYADLLENPDNEKEINDAFENLRDYSEPLKATAENIW